MRITPEFSAEPLKARRTYIDGLRDHRYQLQLLYPAKLSITNERGRKHLTVRTNVSNPALEGTGKGKFSLKRGLTTAHNLRLHITLF